MCNVFTGSDSPLTGSNHQGSDKPYSNMPHSSMTHVLKLLELPIHLHVSGRTMDNVSVMPLSLQLPLP